MSPLSAGELTHKPALNHTWQQQQQRDQPNTSSTRTTSDLESNSTRAAAAGGGRSSVFQADAAAGELAARSKSWWPGWLGGLDSRHPLARASHSFSNGDERRSSGGISMHQSSSSGLLADAERGLGGSSVAHGRAAHRAHHKGRWVVGRNVAFRFLLLEQLMLYVQGHKPLVHLWVGQLRQCMTVSCVGGVHVCFCALQVSRYVTCGWLACYVCCVLLLQC